MGIRINKTLGYILFSPEKLDDLQIEKLTLNDLVQIATEDERKWLNFDLGNEALTESLSKYIRMASAESTGLKTNIYSFIPPNSISTWHRYNNVLDYYGFDGNDATAQIKYIQGQLIPFQNGTYLVSSTLKEIDSINAQRCFIFHHTDLENRVPGLTAELTNLGIDCSRDLADQVHVAPPISVKLMARILGIKEENSLRPAIVTHWS